MSQTLPAVGTLPAARVPHQTPTSGDETPRLVRAAQLGDAHAFDKLCDQHFNLVYNHVYLRAGGAVTVAQELTRETFLKAMVSIRQVRSNVDFGAWLVKIARNIYADRNRSPRFQLARLAAEPLETADAMLAAEHRELLLAVDQLRNPDHQEAIVLTFFQKLTIRQVADIMGKSTNAVVKLLTRAKEKLAATIAPAVGLDALGPAW